MNPTVAISIPCLNGAKHLARVIAAAQAQTVPVQQIVVIDDGSTDDTAGIARRGGANVIAHPQNLGLAAARNTALSNLNVDYVASVDADVILAPTWLEQLLNQIRQNSYDALSGKVIEHDTDNVINQWRAFATPLHWGDAPREGVSLFGAATLIRRQAILDVGGYQTQHRRAFEDMDISNRLIAKGYRTAYEPLAQAYHLRSDTLQSIVNMLQSYRSYPLEQSNAFSDRDKCLRACAVLMMGDVELLDKLRSVGEERLAGISLYVSCMVTLRMLCTFVERHDEPSNENLPFVALLMMMNCLRSIPHIPNSFAKTFSDQLFSNCVPLLSKSFIARSNHRLSGWVAAVETGMLNVPFAELGYSTPEQLSGLRQLFSDLPQIFTFSADEWREITSTFELAAKQRH